MGTTRIKVIDLAADVEQIKTSRKRAQTGTIAEVKKSLISKKKAQKPQKEKVETEKQKLQISQEAVEKEEIEKVLGKEAEKIKASRVKFGKSRGKKYQKAKLLIDQTRFYPVDNALELVKKTNISQFDASVEAHIVVKQKGIRGSVNFPNPFDKLSKILVFVSAKDGLKSNGIILGDEKTVEEIAAKKLVPKRDFGKVIATPEFMPKIATLGKILGPAGLMPNPKTGTVTDKPEDVVKKISSGFAEFKTEAQAAVVHSLIGKISQDVAQLKENLISLVKAINLQKIEKIYLAPTMGPSVKVDLTSLE